MASTSNKEILEHVQSKALCMIVDAPWYTPNMVVRRDLQSPIRRYSSQYSDCLSAHPNYLLVNLMEQPDNKQVIAKIPAKWSDYQTPSVVVLLVLV
jgi:hypothetical protein